MSIFLFIIIFLLSIVFLAIGMVVNFLYRIKQKANRMWQSFTGTAPENGAGDSRRAQQNAYRGPQQRRKKIGRDVGEYVRFEELDVERTVTTADASARVVTESQIVDVAWEEINPA